MTSTAGPLANVTVIEIGRYIGGPYAGRLLADLGAQVIKVEDPEGGDPMRRWESGSRPYSPQFAAYNRGKRSICLDLKTETGRQALIDLAAASDVLLENFRPGVMTRLGIGAEALSKANPRLIYCGINGFGSTGPYAHRPSYDTVISAMGGLYGLIMPVETPSPIGPAVSDLLSGIFAVQAILAALHHRSRTGDGQIIETTMLGSVLSFLTEAVTSTSETGEELEPNTRQRRAQAYGCTDSEGKAFVVHLSVPDKFWLALTNALGHEEWRDDPRFATRQLRYDNYLQLDALIKQAAATRTRDEWFAEFDRLDLPHGPLNTIADVSNDPQVIATGLLEQIPMADGRPMTTTRSASSFSASPVGARGAAPVLGEHTEQVLATLPTSKAV